MKKSDKMLESIVAKLKNSKEFEGIATAEISGQNFSAADIGYHDEDGNVNVYRIVVLKMN